jgi:hypothetical protein
MTKKTFKDSNPALQFISTVASEGEVLAYNTHNTNNKHNTHNINNTPKTASAKTKEETKSKRLNLLLQPSVVSDMEKIATMKRSSVNDLINTILKDFVSQEAEALTKYEEVFGKGEIEKP